MEELLKIPENLQPDGFNKLPMELWSKVLCRFREPRELAKLELVCRRFRTLLMDYCWTQIRQLHLDDDAFSSRGCFFQISLDNTSHIFPSHYPQHQVFPLLSKLSNLNFISIDFLEEDVELLSHIAMEKVEKLVIDIGSFLSDDFSSILKPKSLVNLKQLSLVLSIEQESLESLSDAILNCGAQLEVLKIDLRGDADEIQLLNICSQKTKQLESHSFQTLKVLIIGHGYFDEAPLHIDFLTTCPQLEECKFLVLSRQEIFDNVPAYLKAVLSTGSQQLKIFSVLASNYMYWKTLEDLVRAQVPGVIHCLNRSKNGVSAVFRLDGACVQFIIPNHKDSDDSSSDEI